MPVSVSFSPAASTALAMPKSATSAWPFWSRMFSGLMSRCTTPLRVGVGQRLGGLARDPHGVVDGELLLAVEPVAQRLALDERHHVVEEAARLARVVEAEDVGVLELGGEPDLAQEPLGADGGGELGFSTLIGDLAVVPKVLRQVDGGHAAFAHQALDLIAVAQRGAKLLQNVRHSPALKGGEAQNPSK